MIVVLEGKEVYQLLKMKQKMIQESGVGVDNILSMDASSASSFRMEDALLRCNTVSLFSDRRIVVLQDPYFLKASGAKGTGKGKNKKNSSGDKTVADLLAEYVAHPNPDTDLYFVCDGFAADRRTKEFKVLKEGDGVKILSFTSPTGRELDELMQNAIHSRGLRLSKEAMDELKERINQSATEFYRTLDKLELYGKKNYDKNDIEHLVSFNSEVNIFKLGSSFVERNRTQTIYYYRLMRASGMDVLGIVPSFASHLRNMYAVLLCHEMGYASDRIKERTGRLYPDRDLYSARGLSSDWFLKRLSELADLDQGIKDGTITDPVGRFEYFLLHNMNK